MFKKHKELHDNILGNISNCDNEIAILKDMARKVDVQINQEEQKVVTFTHQYTVPTLLGRVVKLASRLQDLEKYLGIEYEDSKIVGGRYKKKAKK